MNDDDELFSNAMRDVRRIDPPARVTARPSSEITLQPRSSPTGYAVSEAPVQQPEPASEPWILKSDGVSPASLRQLAAGNPSVDREVDLHGMTREEMYRALSRLMEEALDRSWRVFCLVHGRGLHSEDGRPILKKAVYDWLRDGPYAGWVLAVVPKPGTGGGSALVLLRRRR